MEDATKALPYLKPGVGRKTDSRKGEVPVTERWTAPADTRSLGQKTLERWFLDDRGGKLVPKRLDIPNQALVTSGGPIKLTGNIILIDEDGRVSHTNSVNLCRCGASRNGPSCDNSHVDAEFLDRAAISQVSDCLPMSSAQTVTVTCIKNGPLKYQGFLNVVNRKGQQCSTMQGALCRCGRSARKPFCDCQ